MAGVQLYNGLIKATEQIVTKFGKDILTEERFVNILHDLYPDRDNPAVFRIIKTMINNGITSGLKSSNRDNISSFVAKSSLSLSQNFGFDKGLVEGIIYSIAIGYGNITFNEFNELFAPLKQKQPTHYPNQQNTPNWKGNKPVPSKQTQSNQKQAPVRNWIIAKYVFLLLFCYISLLLSPAIYLGLTHNADWWPFFAIIPIAFLHFLSISMVGIEISDDYTNRPMPFAGGVYVGLALCAFFFWILCPIVLGFGLIDLDTIFYGFRPSAETPSVISVLLCLFCGICCLVFIPDAIDFSGIKVPVNNILIFKDKLFRNGFLFTCIFFLIVGIVGWVMPSFCEMWQN